MKQRGKQASVAKFLATKMLSSTEGGWRWKGGFVTTTSVGCDKFLAEMGGLLIAKSLASSPRPRSPSWNSTISKIIRYPAYGQGGEELCPHSLLLRQCGCMTVSCLACCCWG